MVINPVGYHLISLGIDRHRLLNDVLMQQTRPGRKLTLHKMDPFQQVIARGVILITVIALSISIWFHIIKNNTL